MTEPVPAPEPALPLGPDRPPSHKSLLGDREVSILVVGTLVLFALMAALVIYLVLESRSQQNSTAALARSNAAQQNATARIVESENANAIAACQLANTNRTEDTEIIRDILALPAISAPQYITPAARAAQATALVGLRRSVMVAYALRNCPALYSPAKK